MNKQFDDLVKKALGVNGLLVGDILHEDVMSKFWFQGLVDNLFAHLPNFLDEDLRFANAWVPVTPEKAISVKPHPILANPYANNPQGANWQQQQQETTGISSDRVQMGATYNGITQTVSPIEQQHANGGRYGYSYDVSLAEKTEMVDLITAPTAQAPSQNCFVAAAQVGTTIQ
ncbi:hypothetical protein L7F22_016892 [Adiantum nelumboides]|nr:hypothetical protein [Adiantum nelumboides]